MITLLVKLDIMVVLINSSLYKGLIESDLDQKPLTYGVTKSRKFKGHVSIDKKYDLIL